MLRSERHRLDPAIFNLPVEKMRDGYYSDTYFNRAREILERDNYHPRVRMQVFQRNHSVLCGIDEAIAILKLCSGRHDGTRWRDGWNQLDVHALYDGDRVEPFESVLTIEGDYDLVAHLETPFLGVLSRRTRIATNARAIVGLTGRAVPVRPAPARGGPPSVATGVRRRMRDMDLLTSGAPTRVHRGDGPPPMTESEPLFSTVGLIKHPGGIPTRCTAIRLRWPCRLRLRTSAGLRPASPPGDFMMRLRL